MMLIAFGLGMLCAYGSVLLLLILLPGRRPPSVTMHRRRYRDIPLPESEPGREAEVGGIRYEHLGMTGEEA